MLISINDQENDHDHVDVTDNDNNMIIHTATHRTMIPVTNHI